MIINGKQLAKELRVSLSNQVETFKLKNNITPKLVVVLVGEDPASQIYVRNKVRQTKEVGLISEEIKLHESVAQDELLKVIEQLNNDNSVHGILVQLPLPKHINEDKVILAIDPQKDVDGFHPINTGKLTNGIKEALIPCTPQGCILLAKHQLGDDLSGKHVVVVGRSNIVGKPVSLLFLQDNCTVTMTHSKTLNLPRICKQADILIAAVGKPKFIQASWVKDGVTVIDVGINRIVDDLGNYKLVGDVDFDNLISKVGGITPVPGGVGPMTIACLLKNTLEAARIYS